MQDLIAEVASLRAMLAARTSCAACAALNPSPAGVNSQQGAALPPAPPVLSHCSDVSTPAVAVPVATPAAHGTRGSGIRKPRKPRSRAAAKPAGQSRYWTPDEHQLFLAALNMYGHKDLKAISAHVGTRNMTQVRTHSQKYFMRLMREAKRQNPAPIDADDTGASTTPVSGVSASGAGATTTASPVTPAVPSSPRSEDDAVTTSMTPPSPGDVSESKVKSAHESPSGSASARVSSDKYSVPSSCGLMLLSLVGQDTLSTA